jgi:hypothetical protein
MALEETVTRPLGIAAEWLKADAGVSSIIVKRIGPVLHSTMPAIRLADLGPINRSTAGDWRLVQVECWAKDYDTAEQLAAAVERATETARGTYTDGYCSGAHVEAGPYANPDPNSERFRHQLDVALLLYGVAPDA